MQGKKKASPYWWKPVFIRLALFNTRLTVAFGWHTCSHMCVTSVKGQASTLTVLWLLLSSCVSIHSGIVNNHTNIGRDWRTCHDFSPPFSLAWCDSMTWGKLNHVHVHVYVCEHVLCSMGGCHQCSYLVVGVLRAIHPITSRVQRLLRLLCPPVWDTYV